MAELLVRDLAESTVETLASRAKARGHSLEAEVREILDSVARPTKAEALASLDAIRARSRPWKPGEPTAAEMIREDRDSR